MAPSSRMRDGQGTAGALDDAPSTKRQKTSHAAKKPSKVAPSRRTPKSRCTRTLQRSQSASIRRSGNKEAAPGGGTTVSEEGDEEKAEASTDEKSRRGRAAATDPKKATTKRAAPSADSDAPPSSGKNEPRQPKSRATKRRRKSKKKFKFNYGKNPTRSHSAPPIGRKHSKKNQKIIEQRLKEKAEEPLWPRRAWNFNAWHDEAFALVRVVLKERGWKDLGTPCNPENVYNLIDRAQCYKGHTLPRRCLWWVHEDDGRRLKLLPDESMSNARHCLATWMGTDAAVTKVAITQMNNTEPWYPKAFVLPAQKKKMLKYMKSMKTSYWITKPADDYAGKGMRVYKDSQKEFKEIIEPTTGKAFVCQTYVPNSLLVGGFKFHFRMYAILTGVLENFECWLFKGGTGLYSTEPYTTSVKTLGDKFDPYVHLTNWSINFTKGNKRLHRDKPVIGKGCEWPLKETLQFIKNEHPKFDEDDFWKQMTEVCAKSMYKLAQWKNVKAYRKQNYAHPRFENFGLDLIVDDKFKVWLLEANTQVGLNPATKWFPDENCVDKEKVTCFKTGCDNCRGLPSPRHKKNNKVMMDVIAATMNLMRLDTPASERVPKCMIPLHEIANKETMKYWKLAPKD